MIIGMEIKTSAKKLTTEDVIISVGILSGGATHPGNKDKKLSKDPSTIAQVASYNEFGTRDKNKKVIMHPRPFMRNSLSSEEGQKKINELFSVGIRKHNNGDMTTSQVAGLVGVWAMSAVIEEMNRLEVVDTGITKRHITWVRVNQAGVEV